MNRENCTTVIIADDHCSVRNGLEQIINSYQGWSITGKAEDGEVLLQLMARAPADLVISDLIMPKVDGIAAGRLIHERYPRTGLIAHINEDTDGIFLALLKSGYSGIVLKRASEREIITAMNYVAAGDYGFCKAAMERVRRLVEGKKINLKSGRVKTDFKERELQVFKLVAEGFTSSEIGDQLGLSHRTVEEHRQHLKQKLNAASPAEMIFQGIRNGLLYLLPKE